MLYVAEAFGQFLKLFENVLSSVVAVKSAHVKHLLCPVVLSQVNVLSLCYISLLHVCDQCRPWAIKKVPTDFCPYLRQILTDSKNSFSIALCGKFAITTHHTLTASLHYLVKYTLNVKTD